MHTYALLTALFVAALAANVANAATLSAGPVTNTNKPTVGSAVDSSMSSGVNVSVEFIGSGEQGSDSAVSATASTAITISAIAAAYFM